MLRFNLWVFTSLFKLHTDLPKATRGKKRILASVTDTEWFLQCWQESAQTGKMMLLLQQSQRESVPRSHRTRAWHLPSFLLGKHQGFRKGLERVSLGSWATPLHNWIKLINPKMPWKPTNYLNYVHQQESWHHFKGKRQQVESLQKQHS